MPNFIPDIEIEHAKETPITKGLKIATLVGSAIKGYSDVQGLDIPYVEPDKLLQIAPAVSLAVNNTLFQEAPRIYINFKQYSSIRPFAGAISAGIISGIGYSTGWVIGQLSK